MATNAPAQSQRTNWTEVARATDSQVVRAAIDGVTHGWGAGLLAMGVLQLIGVLWGLDPTWGIALLLVAAISFLCPSAALLPVYGVVMGWAMISNLLSGKLLWMAFAALQGYWAFCSFRDFRALRLAASRLGIDLSGKEGQPDRPARLFPWTGCALTLLAWIAIPTLLVVFGVAYALTEQLPTDQALGIMFEGIVNVACLGFAISLAALLARYRRRNVSLLACIGSALMLAGWVALMLFGTA